MTALNEPAMLAAFGRWMESQGTSIEEWTTRCAEHSRPPTFTVALACAYLGDRLNGDLKPSSASQTFGTLLGAVANAGWDIDRVKPHGRKRPQVLLNMVRAATAQMDIDDVRRAPIRARPLTTKVITRMMEHLDHLREQGEVADIWAVWMRGFVLCGFAAAFRINELVQLEWSWCTFEDEGLSIEVPSSKREMRAKRVLIPRGTNLCPVQALEQLRDAYGSRGLHMSHVFAMPDGGRGRGGRRRQSDIGWVDIIDVDLGRAEFHPDAAAHVRHAAAVRVARSRMGREFSWFLTECGISARSAFERPASHGLRRGCATELANAGVTLIDIAKHLRHNSVSGTSIYIDGADLHIVDPAGPSKQWSEADARVLHTSLLELAMRLKPPGTLR